MLLMTDNKEGVKSPISNLVNVFIAPVSQMFDAQTPRQKQVDFHEIEVVRLTALSLNKIHQLATPSRLDKVHGCP